MKLFDVFRRFRKKKKDDFEPEIGREPLPSDLEKFKIRKEPMPEPEPIAPAAPYGPVPEERAAPMPARPMLPEAGPVPEKTVIEKEDMILQKLDTIDARLKLIEEKIK